MSSSVNIEEIEVHNDEEVVETVSVSKEDSDEEEPSIMESEEQEEGLVSHLYELLTNSQGVNVTEALLGISESLDKTNKILYKILQVMKQHLSK